MSESLPAPAGHGPSQDAARRRARVPIEALEGLLRHPAFAHSIGLNVLLKFSADDKLPARERTRAGAALAGLQLRVIDRLAAHLGSRDVALADAGLARAAAAPSSDAAIVINIHPPPEHVAPMTFEAHAEVHAPGLEPSSPAETADPAEHEDDAQEPESDLP